MSDEELKAIASRVRPHAAGNLGNADIADRNALAAAYLAEHPADDAEPITANWLAAVGFTSPGAFTHTIDGGITMEWFSGGDLGQWECIIGDHVCPDFGTRGQLRRLCAALGVPLSE